MLNKKGFFLSELIIVTALITLVVVGLFTQVNSVFNSYKNTFNYNTSSGLYGALNVSILLKQSGIINNNLGNLSTMVIDKRYIDLSDCSFAYNSSYCDNLKTSLKIKKMIFTQYDVTTLQLFDYNNDFNYNEKHFITKLTKLPESTDYRLIIFYEDETAATIKVRL